MFFRLRKSNLSLERAVYKPAVKDSAGNVVVHPVRTTEYVGSLKAHTTYSTVPPELMEKLGVSERAELKEILKENEPKGDYWISSLHHHIHWCIHELHIRVKQNSAPESRKTLELQIKAAEVEWRAFFKAAQDVGLKRKLNRPKKPQPFADASSVQSAAGVETS